MSLHLVFPDDNVTGCSKKEMTEAWDAAISYLDNSSHAKKMIKVLTDSTIKFDVMISARGALAQKDSNPFRSNFVHGVGHNHAPQIRWNPGFRIKVKSKKKHQSPAISLAHELGHAIQFITDGKAFVDNSKTDEDENDIPWYVTHLEDPNVADNETVVCDELSPKEPTRLKYADIQDTSTFSSKFDNTPWKNKVVMHD